jgi:hypothetical protein
MAQVFFRWHLFKVEMRTMSPTIGLVANYLYGWAFVEINWRKS